MNRWLYISAENSAEENTIENTLFGYALDDGPVNTFAPGCMGTGPPDELISALNDKDVLKISHDPGLVRDCLEKTLGVQSPVKQWRSTLVACSYSGLPRDLLSAGKVLGIEKAEEKLSPCCTSEGNLIRKVEVIREIWKNLQEIPVPNLEWLFYRLDQCINRRGVRIDRDFVQKAIALDREQSKKPLARFKQLTGIASPNCTKELVGWLGQQGVQIPNLTEKTVTAILPSVTEPVREVLQLRLQLSKTSIKKYYAMKEAVDKDGRLRDMFNFYGAHTGRWTAVKVQLQNLPKNQLRHLDAARQAVMDGEGPEAISIRFGSPAEVLSQLLRTAFIPAMGCIFYVADYAAIEARVLAWMSGEKWRLRAFANGEDIYCSSASQMFGVPVEKNGKNAQLRQKGKIAELALGYGGSVGALKNMGALQLGLKEAELPDLVKRWRKANPCIVKFWGQVDQVVMRVVNQKSTITLGHLCFRYRESLLTIRLPSGRELFYRDPSLESGQYGTNLVYSGVDATRKYGRIRSYGARIVENITQGIARDLLATAMVKLETSGYHIVMHCHDEVVVEAPESENTREEICSIMQSTPQWADGLPLRADGYTCPYYQKK